MQTVVIVIHLLVVLALVGVVLIQRSEGGGLGIGGGSGFMTARGTKNTLTRLTAVLAACFFLTSIVLTVMQLVPGRDGANILRQLPAQEQKNDVGRVLDSLGGAGAGEAKPDARGAAGGAVSRPAAPQERQAQMPAGGTSSAGASDGGEAPQSGQSAAHSGVPAAQPGQTEAVPE